MRENLNARDYLMSPEIRAEIPCRWYWLALSAWPGFSPDEYYLLLQALRELISYNYCSLLRVCYDGLSVDEF